MNVLNWMVRRACMHVGKYIIIHLREETKYNQRMGDGNRLILSECSPLLAQSTQTQPSHYMRGYEC